MSRASRSFSRHWWLALLPVVFIVYSSSFSSFPVIEKRHSVLGDADFANFIHLIRDFDLGRVYGNPYERVGRDVPDVAQKHKIHHVLYVAVASALYRPLSWLYGVAGLQPSTAVYSVNALLACLNIVLIFLVHRAAFPQVERPGPFLVFYPLALSTWLFGSAPDSWLFTGSLILLFLLVLFRFSRHYLTLAALVGVLMLGNMTLLFLLTLLTLDFLRQGLRSGEVLRRTVLSGFLALTTWLVLLTALSLFDRSFRPDEYARYTLWFKQYVDPHTSVLSPYVWKSVLTNLFVNSVVSNQPDPIVPQDALRTTVQGGGLGAAVVASYVVLMGVVLYRATRAAVARARRGGALLTALLEDRGVFVLCYCAVMVLVTVKLYHPSGFLYSTTVVPLLTLAIGGYLDRGSRVQMALYGCTIALMAVNNTDQVLTFRRVLAGM